MRFIADFHIHSHRSLATSKQSRPEYLSYWAKVKGIHVVGTGDCIHPAYFDELQEKLEESNAGLFQLKDSCRLDEERALSVGVAPPQFILTTEISSIYKKNDRVRKIHSVCVFPSFQAAQRVQKRLDTIGNITSDGRPILGLDARDLLEIVLESDPQSFVIPAHIWTPWFSVLGERSGFDRIEECYDDLSQEIFALETGLSSDPPMNRMCSFLDRYRLVSNSDAHSPNKLGREANIFDIEMTYDGIYAALKHDDGFEGTIEFFPEEGKYHYEGHRKCGVSLNPLESSHGDHICSVCGKPLTRGVASRVMDLADREVPAQVGRQSFRSITSLPAVIAQVLGVKSETSKKVEKEYFRLIGALGSEFDILLHCDELAIRQVAGEDIAGAIARLRNGDVRLTAGYDGVFGKVSVLA